MKRSLAILSLFLSLVLTGPLAFAQAPELRGTWVGKTQVKFHGKKAWEGKVAVVVNEQEGNMFSGYKLYFNPRNVLTREALVGIFDNGKIILAEGKDGYAVGYLTGEQDMIINYVEQGSGLKAVRMHLDRIHFTTGFVEIDKDGDQTIIRAEITKHYPLNAERILEEADKNKDGKLTKKEWEAWKKANDWKE